MVLPLAGMFAGGSSILGQGQLFGGWGFRVFNRRLSLTAALTGTVVATDAYFEEINRQAWFDLAPLLLTAAMTLPLDGLVLVPMLGVTLPTRNGFGSDPVIALQPQVRVRAQTGSLLFGAAAYLNVPVVTLWGPQDNETFVPRRCLPETARCRMPVGREHWRIGLSLQAEFWAWQGLSVGLRVGAELREEDLGQLFIASGSPEGVAFIPSWTALDLNGSMFASWALTDHFGVTTTFGNTWGRHASVAFGSIVGASWEATLSVWFRTDARLNRFWLDR